MNRRVKTLQLYDKTPAGILVPSGSTTDFSLFTTKNIFTTKLEGIELLQLFRTQGLDPSRSPSLLNLVEDTAKLSDGMLTGKDKGTSYFQLFSALQLRRVIDAVHTVVDDSPLARVLAELLDGTLDLLARSQSKAKDTLWELELLRTLRENGVEAQLGEPDLIVSSISRPMGVACKKLYSDENFPKVIQHAVRQIEKSVGIGIVAVNLDDLVPENSVLKTQNEEQAAAILNKTISDFMVKHERSLRYYIEPGRAVAVLVSCAALTDMEDKEPRYCTFRQTIAWHIPSTSQEINARFDEVLQAFHAGAACVNSTVP